MSEKQRLNSLVGDSVDKVSETQGQLQFLINIINAYLDSDINATSVDMCGFAQICRNLEKYINENEDILEEIRTITSKDI